ncbi:flagellar biosynthetic protein FliO [Bacillus sp. Brlt_9]|uniref:flagellar biosynthetic protein FliO n=1 Tax=Bacillus sp. Brlt_9 TaxID=3110916 RepID=UPI003F7C6E5C
MLLNFINIFIIFSILFGLIWFITKKAKNRTWAGMKKSEHIKVVDDGIQMGFGQRLSVIRVEKEYFLYTYGQNGVGFQKLEASHIESQETKWEKEIMGENHQDSFKALGEVFKNEK